MTLGNQMSIANNAVVGVCPTPACILREIERVSEAIRANPLARPLREELGPGLRSAIVFPHAIFCRVRLVA
jgi:hypothetical protein